MGVGQENLVLLVFGGQRLQRRFCGSPFGVGLDGELGQSLHFRGGFGRLGFQPGRSWRQARRGRVSATTAPFFTNSASATFSLASRPVNLAASTDCLSATT